MTVTKLVDLITKILDQLSLHFYDFFCDLLCIFEVHYQTLENMQTHPQMKIRNYNRVLRRPSPPLHLAGGVLLVRAYRGCNVEVRVREEFENHLPRSMFG